MKKVAATWKCAFLLMMLLSVVCLFGNPQKVSAAADDQQATCKVLFANAKGQQPGNYYRNLTKNVEKGAVIELPTVNKAGYQAFWITKINGKEYKYSAGRKVTINQTTKFCLNLYKEYTVSFYTANGRNEYRALRQTVVSGCKIKMPAGNSSETSTFAGWATKAGGSVYRKSGAVVKVTSNLKFYAVQQKISTSGIRLCKYDGTYWKTIKNDNGQATFPAVDMQNGNMCLGWSKSKGKSALSSSDYKAGNRIPAKNGRYYMVIFGRTMDRKPSAITEPTKFDRVYMVGDSRSVDTKLALGTSVPSNVTFIAKGSQGLSWFKSTAYRQLLRAVASRPKTEKKAVVINLGVNDLQNSSAYVTYMKKVAANLKRYNCKMYYMSVNPVNSAMLKRHGGRNRTEQQVAYFNKVIYQKLCSGRGKCFTYINTCTNLQMKGWISNRHNVGTYDGLHYSNETYLRIFDYTMRYLNR